MVASLSLMALPIPPLLAEGVVNLFVLISSEGNTGTRADQLRTDSTLRQFGSVPVISPHTWNLSRMA